VRAQKSIQFSRSLGARATTLSGSPEFQGCDCIAMASHGRRGTAGLLLASQTQLVLTHSILPVLLWRQ
jgi:nucleotide-binding universal stress UspA family protein